MTVSARYDLLHVFSAPQGHLVEIKRTDLHAGAPGSQVFLWLWVAGPAVRTLQFVRMSDSPRQTRCFEEAAVSFDETGPKCVGPMGRRCR